MRFLLSATRVQLQGHRYLPGWETPGQKDQLGFGQIPCSLIVSRMQPHQGIWEGGEARCAHGCVVHADVVPVDLRLPWDGWPRLEATSHRAAECPLEPGLHAGLRHRRTGSRNGTGVLKSMELSVSEALALGMEPHQGNTAEGGWRVDTVTKTSGSHLSYTGLCCRY